MEVPMPNFERVTDYLAPVDEPVGPMGVCNCWNCFAQCFAIEKLWYYTDPSREKMAVISKNIKKYNFWQSTVRQVRESLDN